MAINQNEDLSCYYTDMSITSILHYIILHYIPKNDKYIYLILNYALHLHSQINVYWVMYIVDNVDVGNVIM